MGTVVVVRPGDVEQRRDRRPAVAPIPRTYLYVTSIGGERVEDHRAENGRIFGFGARWADSTGTAVEMQLGEWNTIEVHYVMNTPGVEDGVFEGWLYNSRHPAGIRGVRYDTVQYRDAAHPELGINQLQLAHYYGGAMAPPRPAHVLRRLRDLEGARGAA